MRSGESYRHGLGSALAARGQIVDDVDVGAMSLSRCPPTGISAVRGPEVWCPPTGRSWCPLTRVLLAGGKCPTRRAQDLLALAGMRTLAGESPGLTRVSRAVEADEKVDETGGGKCPDKIDRDGGRHAGPRPRDRTGPGASRGCAW